MDNDDEPEFLISKKNGIEQHFYVGGTVTFEKKPWINSVSELITKIEKPSTIYITGNSATGDVVNVAEAEIWVLEIPQEVRAESLDKGQIAPFKLKDDWDYADDTLYWQWIDATTAARLHCEEIEADCEVINAYSNDVEYFEYEEPESEEEYDPDEEEGE
jgi:hypothetical protein